MEFKLPAAAQTQNAPTGGVRAIWSGGKIEIDETRFLELVARAVAAAMGNNIFEGRRPDGSGPMPARQYDGQPRGKGARIARALAPIKVGPLSWFIAAHREKIGHLQRIMGDVPFLPPPIDSLRAATRAAFEAALTLQAGMASVKQLRLGGATRTALKAPRALVKQQRAALISTLGGLGIGGKKALRASIARHIRRAARHSLRGPKPSTSRRNR